MMSDDGLRADPRLAEVAEHMTKRDGVASAERLTEARAFLAEFDAAAARSGSAKQPIQRPTQASP